MLLLSCASLAAAQSPSFSRSDLLGVSGMQDVIAADVNNDGFIDLFVPFEGKLKVAVLLGQSSGGFAAPVISNVWATTLADMNQDGRLDAIGTDRWWIGIALGQGDGTFVAVGLARADDDPDFPVVQMPSEVVGIADLNVDGRLDVVTQEYGMQRRFLRYYSGNGSGGFVAPGGGYIIDAPQAPLVSAIADFNHDGAADVAVSEPNCSTLQLLLNNGQGGFTPQPFCATPRVMQAASMIAGDFDGNGAADLAGTYDVTLSVVLGNGNGTHVPRRDLTAMQWCTQSPCGALGRLAAADLNGDGLLDLAVVNPTARALIVFTAKNPSEWVAGGQLSTIAEPQTVSIADLNRDGRLDIVTMHGSTISIFFNTTAARPNRIVNGQFSNGAQGWLAWPGSATAIRADASGGSMHFYRPSGSTDGAILQSTGVAVPASTGLELTFRMANSDSLRKRVSVILHDADWSDLALCTFWLLPQQRSGLYVMRVQTGEPWTNATVSFYASSVNSAGSTGAYILDDVSLRLDTSAQPSARTDCVDPGRPWSGGASTMVNLIANGDFGSGALGPWAAWSDLRWQLSSGSNRRLQFFAGTSGAAVLQNTNTTVDKAQRLRATATLGNSSTVRQRITVMLHDGDFSDLAVCHFWLPAGAPLAAYSMTAYATEGWTDATLSFYPGTVGTSPTAEWLQLDDVAVQPTSDLTLGTECVGPGAVPNLVGTMSDAGRTARAISNSRVQSPASPRTQPPPASPSQPDIRTMSVQRHAVELVADDTMQNVVAGFTTALRDNDPLSIDAGIRFGDGVVAVWERGAIGPALAVRAGDVIRIEITREGVIYSRNGSPFHVGGQLGAEPLSFSMMHPRQR